MSTKTSQNGTPAGAGTQTPAQQQTVSSLPPVVGINFGNSYASIAVFTKEDLAECIANEDGERQIACAIAFHGEEMYIGNQAKQQLVKNSQNTITGFRNLLGKKFSEITQSESTTSARVIQHPEQPDIPAYKVQVLQPSPSPLSTTTSAYTTPAASHAPTPRSEPILVDRILTVHEVTTIFLKSLIQSAADFLGKKIEGAVISVPSTFSEEQKKALEKAAEEAGVHVLQLINEAGAAAATTTTPLWNANETLKADRTQLVVDLGASALVLSLLSVREGLTYVLADSHVDTIGANQIDDKLIKFFAADFTKKTKTPLTVCPASNPIDQRAEAKLRLAIEHTKRTISASPGAATCSVESLKEGLDYTGSINRMRFDMLASPVYASVASSISALLASATPAVDAHDIDEVVYVGGSGCLPGLDSRVVVEVGLKEDVETPFARGTVVGGGVGDPTTVLARGCAVQAALIDGLNLDVEGERELREAFERGHEAGDVRSTSATLGVVVPNGLKENKEVGGTWVPVVFKETALPARRVVAFDVEVTESEKRIAFEVCEVAEGYRVEKVVQPVSPNASDDEEDEEPEEVEVKHRTLTKVNTFGGISETAKLAVQVKGKGEERGKWITRVEVQFVVGVDGSVKVEMREVGGEGARGQLTIHA